MCAFGHENLANSLRRDRDVLACLTIEQMWASHFKSLVSALLLCPQFATILRVTEPQLFTNILTARDQRAFIESQTVIPSQRNDLTRGILKPPQHSDSEQLKTSTVENKKLALVNI